MTIHNQYQYQYSNISIYEHTHETRPLHKLYGCIPDQLALSSYHQTWVSFSPSSLNMRSQLQLLQAARTLGCVLLTHQHVHNPRLDAEAQNMSLARAHHATDRLGLVTEPAASPSCLDHVNLVWIMSGFSCQSSILTHIYNIVSVNTHRVEPPEHCCRITHLPKRAQPGQDTAADPRRVLPLRRRKDLYPHVLDSQPLYLRQKTVTKALGKRATA